MEVVAEKRALAEKTSLELIENLEKEIQKEELEEEDNDPDWVDSDSD